MPEMFDILSDLEDRHWNGQTPSAEAELQYLA